MIRKHSRSGFTLIELLVVIGIIALLAALLMAGVMYALSGGPEVSNRNDVMQLSQGLQRFKTEYGRYPPNTIKLCSNMSSYNTANELDRQSVAFLSVMFKNMGDWKGINWANRPGGPTFGNPANPQVDVLEGDQCLVFFLGGPPMVAGNAAQGLVGGFSTNPLNPMDPNTSRKKSMDFPTARLQNRGGSAFPSFIDNYGTQPFVYFSSTNDRFTGYDTTANSLGMKPFFSSAGPPLKFHMPDSYQIVCAGKDKQFGPGGLWNSATAMSYTAGKDDMTNFHDRIMGAP